MGRNVLNFLGQGAEGLDLNKMNERLRVFFTFSASNTKKLFFLVILLASIIRLWGIWHGYPYSYYPDEAHFVKRALSFGSGDLNPHWFHKPAFYMYVLFFEYGLFFLFGKIAGFWSSVSDFAVSYIINPGPFYLIGRLTTVLFSLGSVWIVYKIGERHFKKGTGIIAALLLSLSYGHIAASQDIKADTPAMFFAILSALFLLNYLSEKKQRDLIWGAAFAGIGTATKTYPILMLLPILLSVILIPGPAQGSAARQRKLRTAYLTAVLLGVFTLFYFLCSPYNFLDPLGRTSTFSPLVSVPTKIFSTFTGQKIEQPTDFINQKMPLLPATIDYLRVLIRTNGMGIVIGGIAILGFAYLLSTLNKKTLFFLFYPVLFGCVSVLTYPGYAEPRHQLPLYPFLAITGAALIIWLTRMRSLRTSSVYIGLILSLVYPFYHIVDRAITISRQDTRNIAGIWIERNIPSGTKILLDENGPQLLMSRKCIQERLEKAERIEPNGQFTAHYSTYLGYQLLAANGSVTYNLHEIRFPWWRKSELKTGHHELTSDHDKDFGNPLRTVGVESYDYYLQQGYQYAIVRSNRYGMFLGDGHYTTAFPSFANFYNELFKRGEPIKEFSPYGDSRLGPLIKIIRLVP